MAQASIPLPLEFRERTKAVVTCELCRDPLDDPRALSCSHTFCLTCLKSCTSDKRGGDQGLCPQCYRPFAVPNDGLDSLPLNVIAEMFVGEIVPQTSFVADVKTKKEVKCSACSALVLKDETGLFNLISSPGGSYCYECNIALCQPCACHHSNILVGKQHEVKPFKSRKDLVSILPAPCSVHPDGQVRYYCYECSEAGCGQCFKTDHYGHHYANMKDAGAVLWTQLSVSLKRLNDMRAEAEEWMKEVQERKENLQSTEMDQNENGLKNWLKRKLFSGEDDSHLSDEQKEAKRTRMAEIENINEGVLSIGKQKEDLRKYSEKIQSMQMNAKSEEIIAAFKRSLDECERLINETSSEIKERRLALQEQQNQQGQVSANLATIANVPVGDAPKLERCLSLIVEYGKCRFLWKIQLYSLEDLSHWKTINFAPSLSLRHTVAFLHSDTIYAIGCGKQNNDIWEYSPFAPRWARRTKMLKPKKGCGVFVLDQEMYLFGGSQSLTGTATRDVQSFNLHSNTWTLRTDISTAVCDPVIMEYNGLIYLFGGRIGLHKKIKTVQKYNPATGACFNAGEMPCRGKFHGFRWNKWGIFIGRVSGCIFDFEASVWSSRKQFKSSMYYCSLTLIDDTMHLVGGRTKGREAWRYVDIKCLPLAAFVDNTPGVSWTTRKSIEPNTIRRRQRYTTTTDGMINLNFS